MADIRHARIAELAVAQARNRIVFVEALLGLGGGFDVPGQKRRVDRAGDFLGKDRFAGAGLAFDQKGRSRTMAALTATVRSSVATYESVPSKRVILPSLRFAFDPMS